MPNQASRTIALVLAAMMLNGCTVQRPEQEVATPQHVGLVISQSSPKLLTGSYTDAGQEITFNITQDDSCQTFSVWRSSGELLLRTALCSTGDSLDLGRVFHATGAAGSLISGSMLTPIKDSSSSPALSRLLADPTFALISDLVTELAQRRDQEAARGASAASNCADPVVIIGCFISELIAFLSCSAGDNCCVVSFVGTTCRDCLGLHCP